MENENKETEQPQGIETFDEKEFFDKEILPKMSEILELCRSRRIPVLMNAIKTVREDGSETCLISAVDNRNGITVADLACCAKILQSKPNPTRSILLKMLAEKCK